MSESPILSESEINYLQKLFKHEAYFNWQRTTTL